MPLTLKQVEDKCLLAKGSDQCRFLAEDNSGNFYCIKNTAARIGIDKEVDDFRKKQRAQGVDPDTTGIPLGDNCKGYIFFRHKMQGYDIEP
jgi:hypothetical protein